jgi:hypothetical protein
MVISPENKKADLDDAQNVDAPWPAMRWNNRDGEGAAKSASSGQQGS